MRKLIFCDRNVARDFIVFTEGGDFMVNFCDSFLRVNKIITYDHQTTPKKPFGTNSDGHVNQYHIALSKKSTKNDKLIEILQSSQII